MLGEPLDACPNPVHRGYIVIMEKKMEATGIVGII